MLRIIAKHLPFNPYFSSFCQSPVLQTISIAFLKSLNAQKSFFFEFMMESIKHFKLEICSVVEYPFLKPACTSDKILLFSTNFVILSFIIDVKSLLKQLSKVMPL